ncbi:hypothetical protein U1Q18_040591 [Sarracenia purpurea var. burkii]
MRDIADPVPDSNEAIGISAEESTKCQELVLQGPTAAESVHAPLPQSSSAILVPLSPVGVRINEEDFPALEAAAIGISGSPGSKEPPDKNQRSISVKMPFVAAGRGSELIRAACCYASPNCLFVAYVS